MDTIDWRTPLTTSVRQNIISKIFETLKKNVSVSGPEETNMLRGMAYSFEAEVYSAAVNQTDYFRRLSVKMLTVETSSRNASSVLIPSANNSLPVDPRHLMGNNYSNPSLTNVQPALNTGHLMNNNIWRPSLPNQQRTMETGDWRTLLTPDVRQKIINRIMETLKKHLPFSGPEGINELRRIAARFEERVFTGAVNQTDYLRKISMKMLTMETKSQNAAGSASSIPAANESLPLDPFSHLTDNGFSSPPLPKKEPAVNAGDWRTELSPDSRQKIVNKITETLKEHVPYSGQEGVAELVRIAVSFEDLIFNTAINQVDYCRKISSKMQQATE